MIKKMKLIFFFTEFLIDLLSKHESINKNGFIKYAYLINPFLLIDLSIKINQLLLYFLHGNFGLGWVMFSLDYFITL